jgi:hypothetical protein
MANNYTLFVRNSDDLWAGRDAPAPAQYEVAPDGIWTWFSDRRAIYRNGATYAQYVKANGNVCMARRVESSGDTAEATIHALTQQNDHNNGGFCFLPDGRIFSAYSLHNDTGGTRYRISTNAEDISAWGSTAALTVTTPATYSNPYYLSQTDKVYLHYRSGAGGVGTNPINVRAYDVTAGTWDAERTWLDNASTRPYVKSVGNGVNRIDLFFTDMHPNQGNSSVYHVYMQLDGSGAELFYKSDGTLIGSGPITPADATLVHTGGANRSWVWDLLVKDGVIHALYSTFPNATTDHRLRYAKCVSGSWSTSEVCAMGGRLYSSESYYSGGGALDRGDPAKAFASIQQAGGAWELSEWSTADGGSSWSKLRDVTSGGASSMRNCRPIGVDGGVSGGTRALWWAGVYSSYESYSTAIRGTK